MTDHVDFNLQCPLPITDHQQVLLAHGGGGRLMQQLIEGMFIPAFANPHLETRHDSAVLDIQHTKLAFTTDAYVVEPLFFPGGNIGTLAINGTLNDLAMSGARPLYLSAAFILEEGLPMQTLWQVVQSMRLEAKKSNVRIVTGDTKVVDRGKGDGIFINTSGVGLIEHGLNICPANVQPGDAIVLSGDIGRHGMAIMARREGLAFETEIASDCAPLWGLVDALLQAKIDIHCLRDLTRGGLASALVEIAEAAHLHLSVDEIAIPLQEDVRGACELLGLDPLYVANEGRFIAFVPAHQASQALAILQQSPDAKAARIIGHVKPEPQALVTLRSQIGGQRLVDMLSGRQLPRIC
jgi:hydrogenase expression/formation protein HypE